MGKSGRGYREILAYYYPGTWLGITGRGLQWQRLSGETITLLTVRPDRDRAVLGKAERLARSLSQLTRWPVPGNIEIRVYPDVDTFRNATGEPGWVAGFTEARRIHLQPGARGLGHELAHVLIESQAAADLPLWLREGLAEYLVQPRTAQGEAPALHDADMRQREDAARAIRAYAGAASVVSGLIKRYGEAMVLDWVKRSLPPEVVKASTGSAAAKSK